MRTDFTIRARDGSERDVAVIAPDGTTFAEVAGLLERVVPDTQAAWSGRRRVRADAVVGRGSLASGTVLTADRVAADERATPGAWLEIVGGAGAGRGIAITRRTLTVGRAPSCDLVLADAQASRRHVVLTVTGAGASVRDLDSTHGTWVDAAAVDGERALPSGSLIRVGDTFLAVADAADQVASVRAGAGGALLVNRPPRTLAQPDARVIELPAPPSAGLSPRVQWIAALLPAVAGVVLAFVMHSVQFLAFAALTPLALLAGVFGERRQWRRSTRRAATAHRRAVGRVQGEIAVAVQHEVTLRRAADPDPAALRRIARTPTARLWERRKGDDDLLRVRIGLASLPSAVRVDRGGSITPAVALAAVPCAVDLGRGPVGIAAPPSVRDGLARWIVIQLAVLTSPADVEIAFLMADDGPWTWARWLPHVRGRVASTAAERDALIDDLSDLIRARRAGLAGHSGWTGPRLVVLIDRADSIGALPRIGAVLADGATVGLTALCLDDRVHGLPAGCTQVVRATGEVGSTVDVGAAETVADRVDVDWAERVARALAPLADAQADPSGALPAQCRLAELHDTRSTEQHGADAPSAADVLAKWRRSDGSASTTLGVTANGPLIVDLERDGPHVLIAGTTGAGKSELLQTLVIGLAAGHPPSELTFLLVDYKGGAAFAECGELPHTVGLVTDLDEQLTRRVLTSLDSEIRRRETLFGAANARDLAGYRAGGATLPRLVLVVDEFATLAEELAGFVPGLVAITQRGRSLGLHLVLATQRPSGVVSPEIRANTALRIALRVTSAAESIDVIDGPEAAGIQRRTPGRGFLRIGTTTVAFQAARVAGAFPTEPSERIRVTALDAWRRAAAESTLGGDTDLRRYVRSIRGAAADEPPPRRPWLPPLPTRITLAELAELPAEPPARIPIGLLDLPAQQRRLPLTIDLDAGGSVLIVGGARSGRTSALLSFAVASAGRHSPDDLHLHAVDGTGTGLWALGPLPHLGTLATVQNGIELVARLVHRVQSELGRRRDAPGELPALVLLLDGWEALLAAAEEHDGGRTVERVLALLRDAPAAGATIVITGGRAALAPRLAAQIGTRLVLPLHDPGDYAQAGIDARSVPAAAIPGRGIRGADGAEFQIAQVGATPADLARAVADCSARWQGVRSSPLRLRSLPSRVTLAELPRRRGRCVLGVGGDEAGPIAIDPTAGAARLLVAGPARSGRSTLLCSMLRQCSGKPVVVAAPLRSPVAAAARQAGLRVLGPADPAPELVAHGLLIVDDAEAFAETEVGDALAGWVRADAPNRGVIVAARSEALAVTFRGLAAEIRQARCGVLLQPGPVDGDLLGVSLPRARASTVPGRGVLVPDPAWALGEAPLPIQVAAP